MFMLIPLLAWNHSAEHDCDQLGKKLTPGMHEGLRSSSLHLPAFPVS